MAQWNKAGGENPVRTAVRFPIQLSVTLDTESGPIEAETVNVSAAGLLFSSEVLPPIGTRIVFRMVMPSAVTGAAEDVSVHCVGRVVRHEHVGTTMQAAAVIDEYTLKV